MLFFAYCCALGYNPSALALVTAYPAQAELIQRMLPQRFPQFGRPGFIGTVEAFRVMQAPPIVLVSLVRTTAPGLLGSLPQMISVLSRASLGLYIMGHGAMWANCLSLERLNRQWQSRPSSLQLLPQERNGEVPRLISDSVPASSVVEVSTIAQFREVLDDVLKQKA